METSHAFQVDLHGIVDLFAHHLYSSPRVYLRELLQNSVDAITARRLTEPGCPAAVRLRPDNGGLRVSDTGIGLTSDEAAELLATIGRSSKRLDDLESARGNYLGQFGIGLLSSFMVAEQIEMYSRSAAVPSASPILWRGFADGTYTLENITLEQYAAANAGSNEPGSTVVLRPRHSQEHWLTPDTVLTLASAFGSLLPLDIAIQVKLDDGESLWHRVTEPEPPWHVRYSSAAEREEALSTYCSRVMGFRPLASFDLAVPLVGLTGVAFVLPAATSPAGENTHRVYLKRMLVGGHVPQLLPPWAFFVRCVVDSSELRPTASREALYEDDVLLATREALGRSVRDWVLRVLGEESHLRNEFVRTHHLAIRSLALYDNDMLDLATAVLPYETTLGVMTLQDFFDEQGFVRYASTLEDYRRVAPVARAQGLGIVNAGYVYDADLMGRLAARRPTWDVKQLEVSDVESTLTPLTPDEELSCLDFLLASGQPARELECELWIRRFEPEALPALFLTDPDIEHQRALRATREDADDLWGGLLDDFAKPTSARRLVLNFDNPTVKTLVTSSSTDVQQAGIQSLYITAQLLAGEPLRPRDARVMNDALDTLLRRAVGGATEEKP